MDRIIAGIVLFKPEKERLKNCIEAIIRLELNIIVFDNVGDSKELVSEYGERIIYLTKNKNLGIAYALNRIMEKAEKMGYEWVITMDQDTIIAGNMLSEYKKCISLYDNVAIVCPQVIDRRRVYMSLSNENKVFVETNYCITSASCTNIAIWRELGCFDEWLFIDFVDGDFCKRININGFKILRCNNVVIDQEFGNIKLKKQWKVDFYMWLSRTTRNKNVAKLTYKKNVSPLRVYYVHRNLLYLNKKYENYGGIGYRNFNCNSFVGFLVYFTLPSFVRATKKIEVAKAIIKGFREGRKGSKMIDSYIAIH